MQNNVYKKWLTLGIITLMIGFIFGSAVNAIRFENKQAFDMPTDNSTILNLNNNYTNITVYEAWDMLNDTSNGIQIPIDVRTDGEWNNEHIDTPPPEDPIHYCLDLLQNETGLQEFMALYEGEEVILYCKSGYRSFVATTILIDNNFTGTIYNMIGGILAWKAAGLPTEGEGVPKPDLECNGTLNWPDVKPGETINGFFTVKNIGEPDSLLNWKILTWPSWGNWTFTKSNGEDLKPGDIETVGVSVVAPYEKNRDFSGYLLLINIENGSDYEIIDVSLSTPKNKSLDFNFPLISWLFERFPNAFPILRHMLGL